ncbi:MAG: tetratricopeptide repeat protein [Spirochaetota bacterium]
MKTKIIVFIIIAVVFVYTCTLYAVGRDSTSMPVHTQAMQSSVDYIAMHDLLGLINALYLNEKYGLMNKYIQAYSKKFPPVKEIFFYKGIAALHNKDYNNAITQLHIAIAMQKNYSKAYNACGYIFAQQREWEKALQYFLLAHQYNTYNPFIEYNCALLYYTILDYDKSVLWCSKAIEHKPNFADAFRLYALCMFKQKEYSLSLEYFSKAMEYGLVDTTMYYNRAVVYYSIEQYINAISYATKALKVDDKNIYALRLLGYAQYHNKDYDKALSTCNTALHKSDDVYLKVLKAFCYVQLNKPNYTNLLVEVFGDIIDIKAVAQRFILIVPIEIIEPNHVFYLY